MQELVLPLSIDMGCYKRDTKKNKIGDKKKPFRINFNNYRNANPFFRTAADTNFRKFVKASYPDLHFVSRAVVMYKLVVGDNRLKDVNNIITIMDKFLCDTLTELCVIEDDNYTKLPMIISSYHGKELGNEHCKVAIYDLDSEEDVQLLSKDIVEQIHKIK